MSAGGLTSQREPGGFAESPAGSKDHPGSGGPNGRLALKPSAQSWCAESGRGWRLTAGAMSLALGGLEHLETGGSGVCRTKGCCCGGRRISRQTGTRRSLLPSSGLVAAPSAHCCWLSRGCDHPMPWTRRLRPRNCTSRSSGGWKAEIIRVPVWLSAWRGPPPCCVLTRQRKPDLVSLPVFIRRPHSQNLI